MTHLFIIILNFNGGRDILECLESLVNSNKNSDEFANCNIIVVDNGSTDGSIEEIKERFFPPPRSAFPGTTLGTGHGAHLGGGKLIENKKNLGFAGGMNVGIKYALKKGAKTILLLNQDTVVGKNFLEPLLANPADIVAPVIKFKRKGEWVYDFGGRVNWWWGRPEHIEKNQKSKIKNQNYKLKLKTNKTSKTIDYVSGCAMMVRRPVWEKIGLLDERFFLYFEDIDFCLRAKRAGFKIAVEPKSIIAHKLSEKKKKPVRQHLFNLKSNFIFVNRYIPWYRRKIAYAYLGGLFVRIVWNNFVHR